MSLVIALFTAFENDFDGPFTCPEFIESCAVSCSNQTAEECRVLAGREGKKEGKEKEVGPGSYGWP